MPFKKLNSLRLREYDYSQPGAYFVTICVKHRKNLFGSIENSKMNLSLAGKIADDDITEIAGHYENVDVGEFVVMPNHVHMIIFLYESSGGRQAMPPTEKDKISPRQAMLPTSKENIFNEHSAAHPKSIRLQDIVGSYKSGVSRKIRKHSEYKDFEWQRYYFDHIVRSESGLEKITDYIKLNPSMWTEDIENESYFKSLEKDERRTKAEKIYKNLLI